MGRRSGLYGNYTSWRFAKTTRSSAVGRAIRSGELEVQGDIQVVQNFVALADLAEFDPAELLAPYTGDIAAESIGKVVRGGAKFLRHGFQRQQRYAAEAITEEWRVAPGPLEVAWFAEETAAVERAVEALTTRLEKLEAK